MNMPVSHPAWRPSSLASRYPPGACKCRHRLSPCVTRPFASNRSHGAPPKSPATCRPGRFAQSSAARPSVERVAAIFPAGHSVASHRIPTSVGRCCAGQLQVAPSNCYPLPSRTPHPPKPASLSLARLPTQNHKRHCVLKFARLPLSVGQVKP